MLPGKRDRTRTVWCSPPPQALGPYPFAFGHTSGYGVVKKITTLERKGWVRVGQVPGLSGLWVMRRVEREGRAIHRGGDGVGSRSGMRSW